MTKEHNHTDPGSGENEMDEVAEDLSALLLQFRDYAIIRIDPLGYIQSWNLGAEHIYEYSLSEIVGQHIAVLYGTRGAWNKNSLDLTLKTVLAEGRYEDEGKQYNKEGKAFFANTIITALYKADGSLKGFAIVSRNITRQKMLEAEPANWRLSTKNWRLSPTLFRMTCEHPFARSVGIPLC
jgi:PAS domain S-box-containing protein